MTTISGTNPFASLGLSGQANSSQGTSATQAASSGTSNNTLGQQDFLNLMVAQLKNQDPSKPADSSQLLTDMAQFSTVSGIQDLQNSFATLSSSIQSDQSLQAAGLVNHSVLVPLDHGILPSGGTLSGAVDLPADASQVSVDIYGPGGNLLRQLNLGAQSKGLAAFQWDGLASDGTYSAPGTYTVQAQAMINGQSTAVNPLVAATVNSVTLAGSNGGLSVNLGSLGSVDFSQVRQIQ